MEQIRNCFIKFLKEGMPEKWCFTYSIKYDRGEDGGLDLFQFSVDLLSGESKINSWKIDFEVEKRDFLTGKSWTKTMQDLLEAWSEYAGEKRTRRDLFKLLSHGHYREETLRMLNEIQGEYLMNNKRRIGR